MHSFLSQKNSPMNLKNITSSALLFLPSLSLYIFTAENPRQQTIPDKLPHGGKPATSSQILQIAIQADIPRRRIEQLPKDVEIDNVSRPCARSADEITGAEGYG